MISKMENEGAATKNHSDFSIDHILNKAGANLKSRSSRENLIQYSWLQCTRFCPPKLPRVHRRDTPQKRQLGRFPRIPFSNEQIAALEEKFQDSPYLSSEEAVNLSTRLQLTDVKVKIWFQNRRARKRREEMVHNAKVKMPKIEPSPSEESRAQSSTVGQNNFEEKQCNFERNSAAVVPLIYVSPQNVLEFDRR